MLRKLQVVIFVMITQGSIGQKPDSSILINKFHDSLNLKTKTGYGQRFLLSSYIVPVSMIGFGILSIHNHTLKNVNAEVKEELYTEHPHKQLTIDTYLQFAPAAAVFGLDAFGVKAKHNLRDRSIIYLLSNLILNSTVYPVKKYTHVLRPDGSSYTSFPSGHTAEAFASAEFMWQEYKDVSYWYGIGGYAMAAATGYLRMYNNRHWFGDVVAGAGVGIASTKIAYWLYPKIKQVFFKDKPDRNVLILPSYQNRSLVIAMACRF